MTLAAQGVVAVALLFSGCGGTAGAPGTLSTKATPRTRPPQEAVQTAELSFESGTVGPFLSRGAGANLLLWSRPAGSQRGWWSIALDRSGGAIGIPKRIADSPGQVDLVRLSSVENSQALALASGRNGDVESLWAFALGTSGELKGGPARIASLPNGAVWLDSVRTDDGYLALWAERGDAHAQVLAVPLDAAGLPRSAVTQLHDAASAWQVQAVPGGAVLAVVNSAGQVDVLNVDETGELRSQHTIEGKAAAGPDLDLARVAGGLVLAFSRPEPLQHHLLHVRLSLEGKPEGAATLLVPPRGEQQLLRLVGGEAGYAVWTEPEFSRGFLLAQLAPGGIAEHSVLRLERGDGARPTPEFAATAAGLHVLFWSCVEKAGCREPLLPTLLRSDGKGNVAQLSGFRNRVGGVPNLAWDLRCDGDDCRALSATFSTPAKVELKGHAPGHWALPTVSKAVGPTTSRALLETEPLADLDVANFERGQLVTWLTDFDENIPYETPKTPAPDGRLAPVRAKLISQWLAKDSTAPSEPQVLSYRARSIAGLTLSPRGADALLAWTAIDRQEPQIFTTLVNQQGARLKQRMLTRQKGEPSQLSSTPLVDGWVVSWCNTSNSKTQSYIAKIGPDLNRISQDTNLGEATDIRVVEAWGSLWTLRVSAQTGVLLQGLSPHTLKPTQKEVILSDAHDPSMPRLIRDGDHVLAAWVSAAPAATLHWVELAGPGALSGETKSAVLRNVPTELSVACFDGRCRAAVNSRLGQLQHLKLEAPHSLSQIAAAGPRSLPVLADAEVWFHAPLKDGRPAIHHARIGR